MSSIKFFSLIDKSNSKEVYTSPYYLRENNETVDFDRVFKNLKFYFNRINSGIKQQLESPRLTDDKKKQLKYIKPLDYKIAYRELFNSGGYSTKEYWIKELIDFSEFNKLFYDIVNNMDLFEEE